MGKKYLKTKENSLESSVLGIWQEAAKKTDELEEAGEKISPHEQDLFDDDIFPALKKARYNNIKKLIQKTQKEIAQRPDGLTAKQDVKDFNDLMKMASKIKKGPGNTHMDKELKAFQKKANTMDSHPRDQFAKALEADVGEEAYDYLMGSFLDSFRAKGNKVVNEGFSPKEIKMAIGVASDKRYAGGNMTGATKAIDKIKKGLSNHPQVKAVLKRQNENIEEAQSGGKEEYQKFFNAALKKFKVKSPAEFKSDEEKKKFYDYIDKNWEGDNEKAEGAMSQVREFKIQDMKAALAQVWGMEEGKNPFKKEEEEKEKPVITKGGKTLTGKKPAEIDVNPKIKA